MYMIKATRYSYNVRSIFGLDIEKFMPFNHRNFVFFLAKMSTFVHQRITLLFLENSSN